ncbi:MAG: right-handed parallel beta-helix repeat-containing protein, partial [Thermotogota bacterium]|nr:right-handed parallel beta-helix repeat-containing protein [Thermotogota bacterium]
VVKLRQNNRFLVYGQLQARGKEDQQIYFTDLRDDTVGGDANRDGSETIAEEGWWRSINIQNEGSAVLEWCTLAFGGRSDGATLLKSGTGSIRISNSAIVRSSGDGLRVAAGYSLFESSDNYFGYNSVGMRLGINSSFSDFTSRFESNDLDVHLDGGTISSRVVWGASSEYSMVTGGDIVVAAGASLKVMPGTVIKLRQNNRIIVYGHLEAVGQESAPIYFTDFRNDLVGGDANRDGEATVPASGWWRSISLLTEGTANFEHCTIGYLGVSDMAGVIKSSTGAFSILNSTIHDVTGDGLRIDNASGGAEVSYSTLSYNTGAGLYYKTDGVHIEALTIASNGIGIRLPAGCSVEVDEQTNFDGNNIAIQIDPGTISGRMTWGAPDYISILMNGSVSVASGASLTVKPCSVIKIAQNSFLAVDGELIASGPEDNPIFFTETRDDSVGGALPGDGSLPEAGWWRSINIRSEGSAVFDWCTIAYAGRSDGAAILKSGAGSLRISNSVLSHTSGDGLRLSSGYSSFAHFQNEYSYNTTGIRLGINASFADVTTRFEGNSTDIQLDGGAITGTVSWGSNNDYSMVITGDVSISAGASLSILPGTVIKFRQNNRILVYGSLEALGEADLPICFTDLRDDLVGGDANRDGGETSPAPGWWRSIGIMTDGTASFEHCMIRYAGYGDRCGVLKSSTGAVSITDTIIEKVAGDGFRADNAAGGVKIDRSTFSENSEAGLNCRTDGVSVEESVFVSNDTGVRTVANASLILDDETYFSENSKDIYVEAATISGSVIWRVPKHLSILLSGSTSITRDARLEIKPGTVVKMTQNSMITVDGEFIALGTEEEPVFFTDQRDDSAGGDSNRDVDDTLPVKGWWNSINIRESGSAELDFVDIGYSQNGIVRAGSGSFTLTNSNIHDVSGDALKILAGYSSLNLSNNHFLRNGTGVRLAVNVSFDDPLARFEENAIDVHVDGGTIDADTVFGLSSEYSFYISAEITVSKDATLEIRPGTVLKFAEYRGLRISGRLKSIGTEEEPITFTDWRYDSAGGDANHDGDASLPEPGWWRSIYIQEEG